MPVPKRLSVIWLGLLILLLMPYLVIAIYSYPAYDDFDYAIRAQRGLIAGVTDYYMNWTGRYLATTVQVGVPWIGKLERIFPVVVLLNIMLEIVATWSLFSAIYRRRLFVREMLAPALAFVVMYITHMPNVLEAHYWLAGLATYTFGQSLAMLGVACALSWRPKTRGAVAKVVAALILIFLGCGAHEITTLALLAVVPILALVAWRLRDQRWRLFAAMSVVCAIGFAVMRLAPGNKNRMGHQAYQDAGDVAFTLKSVGQSAWALLVTTWPLDAMNLAGLLLALPLCWVLAGRSRWMRGRGYGHVALLALLAVGVMAGLWAVCFYLLGRTVPSRILNPIYWIFLFSFYGVFTAALSVYRQRGGRRPRIAPPLYALAVVVFLLSVTYDQRGTWLGCVRQLQDEAPRFRQGWAEREKMMAEQMARGERNLVIYSLPAQPRIIAYYDLKAEPEAWANRTYSAYIGVDSVRVIPRPAE